MMRRKHRNPWTACLVGVTAWEQVGAMGFGLQRAGRSQRLRVIRLAADWLEHLAAQTNPTLEEYLPPVFSLHGPVVRRNPPPAATATFMALTGEQELGSAVQASRSHLPPPH